MTLRPYARSGFTKRQATLEKHVPRDANAATPVPGAAANTFGAYVQLTAGLANDFYPHGLNLQLGFQSFTVGHAVVIVELEIATGAAGAEVLYAQVVEMLDLFTIAGGADPFTEYGRTYNIGTTKIPAGVRIAARVRISQAVGAVGSAFTLYLTGHEPPVPVTHAEKALDRILPGIGSPQTLVTPWGATTGIAAGAAWAYGAYVDIFNPAPQDLLILGTSWQAPLTLPNRSRYLALAIGAPGSEVPYAEIPLPARVLFGFGTYQLRRPLLIRSGERVRTAARGGGSTSTCQHQFLYQLV